ncbi:MAG: putative Ig domain-containing protein, partial [Thermoplasmatota archaeon]
LCAAIELGKLGIEVLIIDDKSALGGKLTLQTHQFFGSVALVMRTSLFTATPVNSFLLFAELLDQEPLEVYSVKTYSDKDHLKESSSFDLGQSVYIELRGLDSNTTRKNFANVNISFGISPLNLKKLRLVETGEDTGIYQGDFTIPPGTTYTDTVKIYSRKDPTKLSNILIEPPNRPETIFDLEIFSDPEGNIPTDKLDMGDTGYARISGIDADPGSANKALARLSGITNTSITYIFSVQETGVDTGIYIGGFEVPEELSYFDNFSVVSVRNPTFLDTFMIHTPVQIRPLQDVTKAKEDEEYRSGYWNFGYETGIWSTSFDAPWLNWDEENKELYGTPNNNHIGPWDVLVEISDGKGHLDSHDFQIKVQNTPPNITTKNVIFATEGVDYIVDYNSSDDGQGDMTWDVIPDNSWFSINERNGVLSGLPRNNDVGTINISIIVDDGRGGTGTTSFMLTVIGVNQAPMITSADIKTGKQGDKFYRDYEALDPDGDTDLLWELYTDASFLTIDNETGELEGTPGPYDVGVWWVNVTVYDGGGLFGSHEFELTIEDEKDKPIWLDVPDDLELLHGTSFKFDVNATDPDVGDDIEYTVWTDPDSDMDINLRSGILEWDVDFLVFEDDDDEIEINLKASDGAMFATYTFFIKVIPTQSPTSYLLGPQDGGRTPSKATELTWQGLDPEDEELSFTIYIHENQAFVEGRREEALFLDDYQGTSLNVSILEPGKTYYWSVIPFDHCTYGTNEDGVRSFRINNAPKITDIPDQTAKTGSEFTYRVKASDTDPEDSTILMYTIEDGPLGIDISEGTGAIKWKPKDDQVGFHSITVGVWDGYEKTTLTFSVEVLEGEEEASQFVLILIIGAAVLIVIVAVVLFFVFRKRDQKVEVKKKDEFDDEAAQIMKEMEMRKKEQEWEREHMKPHEPENDVSSVPLSATEAHAHDKDQRYHQPDYEGLYGQPAPEIEEGEITAKELKGSLQEQIAELEQMDMPEEEKDPLDSLIAGAEITTKDIEE